MYVETLEICGIENAVKAMRMPYESHKNSDSKICADVLDCPRKPCTPSKGGGTFCIGKNDMDLMKKLIKSGSEHRSFLRFIMCYAEISAPRFWWQEMDRYRIGKEQISSSTMHLITKRELTLEDFEDGEDDDVLNDTINSINQVINTGVLTEKEKKYRIKCLLPESFLQKRIVVFSYETLLTIYNQRKNHELPQWQDFCDWIYRLDYMKEFIGDK